jgi:hypothetical protein
LEEKKLPYIVVARMTSSIRARCTGLTEWTALDDNYAVSQIWLKLHGWTVERRFVVLREREREDKSAVGRRLIEVPGYTFRIFVTKSCESAEIIWRDYNGRACIEQRIEELKNDLAAGGFCVREFFGTESAFLGLLFTFNLLSLYQRQVTPEKPYRQPATLRSQVFVAGAILGLVGKQIAIKLSQAWGGLSKHKHFIDAALQWRPPTPPKLDSDPLSPCVMSACT